jgi:hypothetical protein
MTQDTSGHDTTLTFHSSAVVSDGKGRNARVSVATLQDGSEMGWDLNDMTQDMSGHDTTPMQHRHNTDTTRQNTDTTLQSKSTRLRMTRQHKLLLHARHSTLQIHSLHTTTIH